MVYLFLADGFEEIEALTPVDMLRRAGIEVTTVSLNDTVTVTGSHNIKVNADTTTSEVSPFDIEMVILPGGLPGADNLYADKTVHMFIDKAYESKAYLAAICAAPRVYGKKGLLKNVKATCYPGSEVYLEGARYSDEGVVRDGMFITAKGMGKSIDFAYELIAVLKDKDTAEKIKKAIFA